MGQSMNVYLYVLIGTGITFLATVLGASVVFFVKGLKPTFHKLCLGFSSGIMLAAAVWSLIIPATEMATENGVFPIIPVLSGFILGCLFIFIVEKILSFYEKRKNLTLKRSGVLFIAVTLHNIPEGMAVGLALALACLENSGIASAFTLAIGMAIQNIPEGATISLPLRHEGMSRFKAFTFGAISGIVEPIGGILTVLLIGSITGILPYLLAFSAGAMVYVTIKELLPESQSEGKSMLGTIAFIVGFLLMMTLDICLG